MCLLRLRLPALSDEAIYVSGSKPNSATECTAQARLFQGAAMGFFRGVKGS